MSLKRLQLLGLPCVVLQAAEVPLGASRPMQLLALLAADGSWHRRDDLARLFWPERPNKSARSNLRNLLVKTLAAAPFAPVESTEHALRLQVPSDLQALDAAHRGADWETVLRLGGADLLQGFEHDATEPFVQWLLGERAARLAQWRQAVQALLAPAAAPCERRQALAEAWARRCPEDEDAVQARLVLAHERGQGAAAARIYREFEAFLQQEFGVRPSRELERLALQAAPAAPVAAAEAVPPASVPARPRLFGRRLELAQIGALLADESVRLISVTGPGGVGKSTLLAALQAQCVASGRDEARLVDASGAQSPAAVVAALGAAFGLGGLQGEHNAEPLAQALRDRRCLLLVDGAEQPGLAGPLALLLERCPQLRLLVASRSRLHLDAELVVPIDGFPLPDAEETDAEVLATNDAVRYFAGVMRQAGQAPDLAREARTIARLARAVEGLPLALKLLAQLTHLFPLPQLLDSVRRHVAGRPDADAPAIGELLPALVASFERSWTALAPAQQAVLARLAVFASPFDLAAARAVGRTVLPVITSLVDASLLRTEGAGRLSLHAAIRACVLARCPPDAAIEGDYVEHYRQRLAALARVARTRSVRPVREFLREDGVHVESAWQMALQGRAFDTLLSLAESLWFMADDISGPVDGWQASFVQAEGLLREDPAAPPTLRALLAAGAARSAYYQGQLERTAGLARGALRLAQRARHRDAMTFALDTLVRVCQAQRQEREGTALLARLAALVPPGHDDGLFEARVLRLEQGLNFLRGDIEANLRNADRLADLYERFEDVDSMVRMRLAQAFVRSTQGDLEGAIGGMERAAAQAEERGANPALQATALCEAAGWLMERGQVERARACMVRANAIAFDRPQAQFLRLKSCLLNAALAVAAADVQAAAPPLDELLGAIGSGEELPLAEPAFLVAARALLLLQEREAAVEVLRAVCPQVWEMRTWEAAQALLRELGEAPAPADAPSERTPAEVAAAATQARHCLQQALERGRRSPGSASEAPPKRPR